MRAGIVTFHRADNFGAVLQAYALQKTLADLGVDSELLEFDGPGRKAGPSDAPAPKGPPAFVKRLREAERRGQPCSMTFAENICGVPLRCAQNRPESSMACMTFSWRAAIRFGICTCRRRTRGIFSRLPRRKSEFPMPPALGWMRFPTI